MNIKKLNEELKNVICTKVINEDLLTVQGKGTIDAIIDINGTQKEIHDISVGVTGKVNGRFERDIYGTGEPYAYNGYVYEPDEVEYDLDDIYFEDEDELYDENDIKGDAENPIYPEIKIVKILDSDIEWDEVIDGEPDYIELD